MRVMTWRLISALALIHGWDLRAPGEAYRIRVPPQLGVITCVAAESGTDPRWLVAGTTAGALALVDLRFGLSVAEWRHPAGAAAPIDSLAMARSAGGGGGHSGGGGARPLVWAAAGRDEVGRCRLTLSNPR